MNQKRVKIPSLVFFYFSFTISPIVRCGSEEKVLEWIEPSSCRNNKEYDFFHTDSLRCEKCSNNLVASDDGYGCVCDKKSKTVGLKDGLPVCISCGAGKIHTADKFECISCRERGEFCGCWGNYKTVERNWNGTLLDTQQCLPCPKNTYTSHDHLQCLPCSEIWSRDDRDDFFFDDPSWDHLRKYCTPIDVPKNWPDIQSTYTIAFNEKRIHIDSYYFRSELRFVFYSCENGVQRACSQLANMCSLTLFATQSIACKLFFRQNELNDRPKIFYREGEAKSILNRKTITQRYTLDQRDPRSNRLKLVVAKFGLRGKFEGISEPNLPCPFFGNLFFGVNLYKKCKIPATELTNTKMTFLVPFLAYYEKINTNKKILQPVPVFIKNINENLVEEDLTKWKLVKRFFPIDKITGYRVLSNSKNSSFSKGLELHVIRYIKSLHFLVKLQEREERGKIFPPLLIVEYDELTNREIVENVEVSVEYKVSYSFSDDEASRAIEVCIGIFTGFAVAFSMLQAWSYSRRSCKNLASVSAIVSFFIYSFGAVGNILLIICSGSCIHTFVFYKGQKVVHLLLPNSGNEWIVKICTIIAFAFKTIEILSLIYHQRRTNIFFIDWEQPKITFDAISSTNKWDSPRLSLGKHLTNGGKLSSSNERRKNMQSASEIIGARRKKTTSPSRSSASMSSSRESIDNEFSNDNPTVGQPVATVCSEIDFSVDEQNIEDKNHCVSIWRTCVVANEWLRLKTKRKINILLQVFATLFFLEILGGKYSSKAIPDLVIEPDDTLSIAESFTLQYAVGILIYLAVYTFQWWFSVFIYQRYVKNQLQEFIDLCSMANISVFMLSHDYYGYYIHGRSVHGFADTDLLTLIKDLKREENDLCAHRGLIPGTIEQTFVISVSKTFRTFYERLVGSENSRHGKFLRSNIPNGPADWDERWKIHLKLKKFFTGFVDHCYKNVDYTVKDRHFLEKMCDFEMLEVHEKSIFYVDNAYSFDRTIFHGNEWSLATYEINVFLLILVFWGNFILALFAVLLVSKTMSAAVQFNGKRLLAEKTFIDERFLVS